MITFPNAKINIGLYITGKRPDGYHNIESVFYPIPLRDALEIVVADELKFTTSGLDIPGDQDKNLCLKAYHLMAESYEKVKPVHIHLQKNIPMGAGLGGGSADGAFTINLLNNFFNLNLDVTTRESIAAQLGSDCPFFIDNIPKLVTGRGEVMHTHPLNLKGWFLSVVSPQIHVSTSEAYAGIQPGSVSMDWEKLTDDVSSWSEMGVVNQFEATVAKKHPKILDIKNQLLRDGALYASMTGSGSSVYGLFKEKPDLEISGARILEL